MTIYLTMLETPALCLLEVSNNFIWGEDLLKSPFKCGSNPIFNIELKMNEGGAYFSTDPASFEVSTRRIHPYFYIGLKNILELTFLNKKIFKKYEHFLITKTYKKKRSHLLNENRLNINE